MATHEERLSDLAKLSNTYIPNGYTHAQCSKGIVHYASNFLNAFEPQGDDEAQSLALHRLAFPSRYSPHGDIGTSHS